MKIKTFLAKYGIGIMIILLILTAAFLVGIRTDKRSSAVEHLFIITMFDESGEKIASNGFSAWNDLNAFEGFASARIEQIWGGYKLCTFELQVVREADPNSLKETEARIRAGPGK